MNECGQKIQETRKNKKMTQMELAHKSGIAVNSLRNYESGKRNPTVDILEKIAAALNIGVSDLLGKNEIIHESVKTVNEAFFVYDKYRDLLDEVLSSGNLPDSYVDEIKKKCPTKEELHSAFDVISAMGANYTLKKLISPNVKFLTSEELHAINAFIEVLTENRIKNF